MSLLAMQAHSGTVQPSPAQGGGGVRVVASFRIVRECKLANKSVNRSETFNSY